MTTETVQKQKRSGEEILKLVREVKRMVEAGNTINYSCNKVGINFKTYTNNQGRVRTNAHLYGNSYAKMTPPKVSKMNMDKMPDVIQDFDNFEKLYLEIKMQNVKLKSIIADLLLKQI
jgi:hypothetical protein